MAREWEEVMRRSILEYFGLLVIGLLLGGVIYHFSVHPAKYSGIPPESEEKILPGYAAAPLSGMMKAGETRYKLVHDHLTAILHYQPMPQCAEKTLLDGVGDGVEKGKPCAMLQLTLISSLPDARHNTAPDHMVSGEKAISRQVTVINLASYLPLADSSTAKPLIKEAHSAQTHPLKGQRYETRLAILGFDPANIMPQILVGGYSGGVHCCEVTRLLWMNDIGQWRAVALPDQIGRQFPPISFVPHVAPVFVLSDTGFLGKFASPAESYLPPVLLSFNHESLQNVTANPAYRSLLLENIRLANTSCLREGKRETNGYLAYYVAMLSRLNHFSGAWRYSLIHQDHNAQDKNGTSITQGRNDFASHLRDILLERGYLRPEEAQTVPLTVNQLSLAEKAHFSSVESLFDMLPEAASLSPKQAMLCVLGQMGLSRVGVLQ